jgi:hypothetical protein
LTQGFVSCALLVRVTHSKKTDMVTFEIIFGILHTELAAGIHSNTGIRSRERRTYTSKKAVLSSYTRTSIHKAFTHRFQ